MGNYGKKCEKFWEWFVKPHLVGITTFPWKDFSILPAGLVVTPCGGDYLKLPSKKIFHKIALKRAADQGLSDEEIFDDLQGQGIFMLVSSRKIAREKLLPLYYTRDRVEKIFEICRQG